MTRRELANGIYEHILEEGKNNGMKREDFVKVLLDGVVNPQTKNREYLEAWYKQYQIGKVR